MSPTVALEAIRDYYASESGSNRLTDSHGLRQSQIDIDPEYRLPASRLTDPQGLRFEQGVENEAETSPKISHVEFESSNNNEPFEANLTRFTDMKLSQMEGRKSNAQQAVPALNGQIFAIQEALRESETSFENSEFLKSQKNSKPVTPSPQLQQAPQLRHSDLPAHPPSSTPSVNSSQADTPKLSKIEELARSFQKKNEQQNKAPNSPRPKSETEERNQRRLERLLEEYENNPELRDQTHAQLPDFYFYLDQYEKDPYIRDWAEANLSPAVLESVVLSLRAKKFSEGSLKNSVLRQNRNGSSESVSSKYQAIKASKTSQNPMITSELFQSQMERNVSLGGQAEGVALAMKSTRGDVRCVHILPPLMIGKEYYFQTVEEKREKGGPETIRVVTRNESGKVVSDMPALILDFGRRYFNSLKEDRDEAELLEEVNVQIRNDQGQLVTVVPIKNRFAMKQRKTQNLRTILDPRQNQVVEGKLESENSSITITSLRPILVGAEYFRQSIIRIDSKTEGFSVVLETRAASGRVVDSRIIDPSDLGSGHYSEILQENISDAGRRTYFVSTNNNSDKCIAIVEIAFDLAPFQEAGYNWLIELVSARNKDKKTTMVVRDKDVQHPLTLIQTIEQHTQNEDNFAEPQILYEYIPNIALSYSEEEDVPEVDGDVADVDAVRYVNSARESRLTNTSLLPINIFRRLSSDRNPFVSYDRKKRADKKKRKAEQ